MSLQMIELTEAEPESEGESSPPIALEYAARTDKSRRPLLVMLATPAAAGTALAVHYWLPNNEAALSTNAYPLLLAGILALSLIAFVAQLSVSPVRNWLLPKAPLMAAATLLLCVWELITLKLALLPLPFFPGPEGVLQSLINDRNLLADSTWHSLILLMGGYFAGTIAGLISGVTIGWSSKARYWGMPILKIVGPIPATAWIPLAMVVCPWAILSAVSLIALAVWFPVTMLTASGISNTKASYLDVARTMGAGRWYLIFRVAIPAAMPSIFVGLFMGLGTSFLTLVVAETIGVKSGLGWYVSWAQGWAEYGKVYAAIVIMAAFFSTIMTLLFKLRDRVLVWQKGVIKW